MPLLEIRNLVVRYGEIEALRGVTIAVEQGQVVTLLGANGAGKSTTLRAISGLAKPASGDILFDGHSIAGLGPEAIVRLGISHVPEGRRVFPGLTVKENIMLGASNRKVSASQISREADAMFDLFPDIRAFSNALGWTLSGGQLQMVAVARGLMARYAVQHKVATPKKLEGFDLEGYAFAPAASEPDRLVFRRKA